MSVGVNSAYYSTLYKYGILAQTGITSTAITTINNGNYGNSGGAGQNTPGAFVGTYDQIDTVAATGQVTSLINDIATYVSTIPSNTTTLATPVGSVTLSPNINYNASASIVFTTGSLITFDAGGNPNAQFFITAGTGNITLPNIGMSLINGALASNIFWVAGTSITFTGASPSTPVYGTFIAKAANVTFTAATTINGNIFISTAGTQITFVGTTTINATTGSVVCYLKGTQILTTKGFQKIEDLTIKDHVITRGSFYRQEYYVKEAMKIRPIHWIGSFELHNLNQESHPICIQKHALGENLPIEDLYVSPNHGVVVNGKLVLARRLVNKKGTIYQDFTHSKAEYYHIEVEGHCAIIANGLLGESYLEVKNRKMFQKGQYNNLNKKVPKLNFVDSSKHRIQI